MNGNLVQRFKLQEAVEKDIVPDEPSKVWGDNAQKRQEVFKSRKEYMVLQARKYDLIFLSNSYGAPAIELILRIEGCDQIGPIC